MADPATQKSFGVRRLDAAVVSYDYKHNNICDILAKRRAEISSVHHYQRSAEEGTVVTSLIPTRFIMPIVAMSLIAVGTTKVIVTEAAEEKAVPTQERQAAVEMESYAEVAEEPLIPAEPGSLDFQPREKGYHILVDKSGRKMSIFVSGREYRTYTIYLGFTPDGHKTRRGDGRTPEGEYYVCKRNTQSAYYRSLLISYPSPDDARQGVKSGLVNGSVLSEVTSAYQRGVPPPQNTRLGGSICIHGEGSRSRPREDWTAGCVAVTNKEMAEIFSLIPLGTPSPFCRKSLHSECGK